MVSSLFVSGDWYPSGFYVWTNQNSKISIWTVNYMLQFELFNTILTTPFSLLSGFTFTNTDDSQDSRGREETIFPHSSTSTPAHVHSDIYLQLCTWDNCHIFLIALLVVTRLLFDEINTLLNYHVINSWYDVTFCLIVYLIIWC